MYASGTIISVSYVLQFANSWENSSIQQIQICECVGMHFPTVVMHDIHDDPDVFFKLICFHVVPYSSMLSTSNMSKTPFCDLCTQVSPCWEPTKFSKTCSGGYGQTVQLLTGLGEPSFFGGPDVFGNFGILGPGSTSRLFS